MRNIISRKIIVRGLVQGVGFRPFVYRLATYHNLTGWVENRNDAVAICVQGESNSVAVFERDLLDKKPKIANIHDITSEPADPFRMEEFVIKWSQDVNDKVTEISPDISVCDECLEDMRHQPHRLNYPFINCTNCGPRFSIIRDLPYDRDKTTMDIFEMCKDCAKEFEDVSDRRFHAQPIACNNCGPVYTLYYDNRHTGRYSKLLEILSTRVNQGGIILVKGIGGYFIACDALNGEAVDRLRNIKKRYGKPFAVMFRDLASAGPFVALNDMEKEELSSWRRPIVIASAKKPLPHGVSNGFNTVGIMLPYLPLHYHLFERIESPVMVMTSGNFSEEPILIDDKLALKLFTGKVDAIVTNNREIYNRVDDSVLMVAGDKTRLLRRSRGYVPEPVFTNRITDGILGVGAELVNCFCVGKDKKAVMSQHIGDLQNYETLDFFEESVERFLKLLRVKPRLVVHDLHPDYLSTKYAQQLGIPTVAVQHHHAHITSCMAEYGLEEKVIGISFDGTGLGTDNHIWGSEFFVCDTVSFDRLYHFDYVPMPGGDLAVKEPWRMTLAYLIKIFGKDSINRYPGLFNYIEPGKLDLVIEAIEKKVNTPLTCGTGRLFDAVSALLKICTSSYFHAEAPMRLETIANNAITAKYEYDFGNVIGFEPMFVSILDDLSKKVSISDIAAKFQNTVVDVIITGAEKIKKDTGMEDVVLSGGTFQNRYILERVKKSLILRKFEVYMQARIPSNDGGIALGQVWTGTNYLN